MSVESEITTSKLCSTFREDHFVFIWSFQSRLICCRPELAGLCITDIAERAPIVASSVLAPPRNGQILPSAVAAAGVGDHHVIPAVGQQLHLRRRRIRAVEHAHRGFGGACWFLYIGQLGSSQMKARGPESSFL